MLFDVHAAIQKTRASAMSARDAQVAEVIKSFNTWAFKREQPSDLSLLARTIAASVDSRIPVHFIMYWGKGPRSRPALPETDCLNYLSALRDRIAAVYNHGAVFSLILTDTHARLNRFAEHDIAEYFEGMRVLAQKHACQTRRLSDVLAEADIDCDSYVDQEIDAELLKELTRSAEKWYGGDLTPEGAAQRYFDMNMLEKRAVEQIFPGSIFVTFNNGRVRRLFPDNLPIFFMYSIRKGVAVKPWFM